jgi:glucosamine-6-phosphate deaminase
VANPKIFRGANLSEEDWRRYGYAYYRLVERVDREVGRILSALSDSGLARNTLVVFTSDHGDGLGAHQWNQKWALYEECVRIPLIMRLPEVSPAGQVDRKHLVSNGLDLYPTFCDFAGVEAPSELPGLSLRPLLEGREPDRWREFVAVETWFGQCIGGLGTHGRMVRTARHKYVLYSWGKYREQLFDLVSDSGEMRNLAVQADCNDVLARHRELLSDWLRITDDQYHRHYAHPDALPRVPGQEY